MLSKLFSTKRSRMLALMLCDIIACILASFVALWVRFDFSISKIPHEYGYNSLKYAPIYVVGVLVVFYFFHLYSYMWAKASIREMLMTVAACFVATLLQITGMIILEWHQPRSYYILCFLVLTILVGLTRYSWRLRKSFVATTFNRNSEDTAKIIIYGAGDAGVAVLRELRNSEYTEGECVCFVDDDKEKQGQIVSGVRVEGRGSDIGSLAEKYSVDRVYIAMPSASAKARKDIITLCQNAGIKDIRSLPGTYQLMNSKNVSLAALNKVSIDDLLGREPIVVDNTEVFNNLKGKTILVTGGGGSIGSELVRQIMSHSPRKLIVLDIYENNVYDLQQELRRKGITENIEFLIGSVRNTHRMESIFDDYRPDIVFHAAAHKHVPLMEDSPNEAIKNNVFGTLKTARAAEKYGCEKFVLISTDKAVNPTNIMGASKRICEMIIQAKAARQKEIAEGIMEPTEKNQGKTQFVAVRFGNVLGSNGSVIPLFKKQIEAGGPVTVTHPDIIRYFMTIPEAVSLVLQASVYAQGGEIFVLDMGEPVKILELAENMIRLMGYEPYKDIDIKFTGLRPGEKLYEELLMGEEGLKETPNKMIHIGRPIEMDYEKFREDLKSLMETSNNDSENIKKTVSSLVPTYNPKNVVM
ncbi:NDP-sugar epimerase, includes UDP-GlcNAc-inverting 4,6-dehydratase FlaA1 and capsular polysaccharide biosynthesis protein EpsC [Lachnospiraceae bacterium NE2001]|nr:NDP-sugar epimerase, includes UDP-GlcNAc-inverting 4,6-dehydratase FlaA1 and capsular polysaccharide biosynthesis protein EpsC [Lachnospiraceae bacterium NE2001]